MKTTVRLTSREISISGDTTLLFSLVDKLDPSDRSVVKATLLSAGFKELKSNVFVK